MTVVVPTERNNIRDADAGGLMACLFFGFNILTARVVPSYRYDVARDAVDRDPRSCRQRCTGCTEALQRCSGTFEKGAKCAYYSGDEPGTWLIWCWTASTLSSDQGQASGISIFSELSNISGSLNTFLIGFEAVQW